MLAVAIVQGTLGARAAQARVLAPGVTVQSPPVLGITSIEPTVDTNAPGQAEAFPFIAAGSAKSVTVEVYIDTHNTATTVKVGLYSAATSGPGSVLTSGSLASPKKAAWNGVGVTALSLVKGKKYWLALLGEGGTIAFRDASTGGCSSITAAQSNLTALPASWTGGSSWPTCQLSAYMPADPTAPPSNTVAPLLSGSAVVGNALSTSTGTWSGYPTSIHVRLERLQRARRGLQRRSPAPAPRDTRCRARTSATRSDRP